MKGKPDKEDSTGISKKNTIICSLGLGGGEAWSEGKGEVE